MISEKTLGNLSRTMSDLTRSVQDLASATAANKATPTWARASQLDTLGRFCHALATRWGL